MAKFIVLATRQGRIKRIALSELAAVRPSGIIAINLDEGDKLGWARLTTGQDEIILVTEHGQALRFSENEIRPTGRAAGGITAIRLEAQDRVASMELVEADGDLLVITSQGYGKRTSLREYPVKGRATAGVQTIDKEAISKIGLVAAARVVQEDNELTIISANGMVLRSRVRQVKRAGRATRGVRLMEINEGDRVVALARLAANEPKEQSKPEEALPSEAQAQMELPFAQ